MMEEAACGYIGIHHYCSLTVKIWLRVKVQVHHELRRDAFFLSHHFHHCQKS